MSDSGMSTTRHPVPSRIWVLIVVTVVIKIGCLSLVAALLPLPTTYSSGDALLVIVAPGASTSTSASSIPGSSNQFFRIKTNSNAHSSAHSNDHSNTDSNSNSNSAYKMLEDAFERYTELTFPHPARATNNSKTTRATNMDARRLDDPDMDAYANTDTNTKTNAEALIFTELALTELIVEVNDIHDTAPPQLRTDESYTLTIDITNINHTNLRKSGSGSDSNIAIGRLQAQTVYGALRGLETFSQLVIFDFVAATYHLDCPDWGVPLYIFDVPRFPHRGLMIDTARHFLPVKTIQHIIESMSYAKLNVLHWHMSDTQSFPLELTSRPNLWDGSHSIHERYLKQEVRLLVEYAKNRGIRVLPEFDVPGHAASWCVGYPQVCPQNKTCQQPLNVARNETFQLINDIIAECAGASIDDDIDSEYDLERERKQREALFDDDFFHLGGDEVGTSCWESDAEITAWLADRDMTPDDGYAYFVKKAASIAVKYGRRPVQWSEVYDHFKTDLEPSTVVHIWKGSTNVTQVVENGFDTLVNVGYNANSWYLDNLNVPWDAMYENDPCHGIPDDRPDLCTKVLGGHGEMWGETVDTSDLDSTVWPRLAAIAERLWSQKNQTKHASDALTRVEYFRCLLNERGVAAAPVKNKNSRESPTEPGSCYNQRRHLRPHPGV